MLGIFTSIIFCSFLSDCNEKQNEIAPKEFSPINSTSYTKAYDAYVNNTSLDKGYLFENWSNAGYENGNAIPSYNMLNDIPIYEVSDYGAIPNNGKDDLQAIQDAIDDASENGGGIIKFEAGQYDLNIDDDGSVFELSHAIQIKNSNIIIQGSREGEEGTTIKQWKKVNQSSPFHDSVRTPHTINFMGGYNQSRVNWFASDVKVGDKYIPLKILTKPEPGDSIIILMFSWKQPRTPSDTEWDREKKALSPLYDDGLEKRNNLNPSYRLMQIKRKVVSIDGNTIEIDTPLPRDYNVSDLSAMYVEYYKLNQCGIRDINIESVHKGDYWEGEYDTGGIKFDKVEDCWVENVNIHNTILDISINRSRNITVKNINITGSIGHHGVGLYDSYNSLVDGIYQYAGRNHLLSFNFQSSGNVMRNIYNLSEKDYRIGSGIDFHSGFASFNLVENITNTKIASSGGKTNNASSGQYNVLWNVRKGNHQTEGYGLFNYCWYTSYAYNGPFSARRDCYRRHPKMLYIGVTNYSNDELITINNSSNDMVDEWRYIEGMNNKDVYPKSLYEAQKNKEYKKHPTLKGIRSIVVNKGDEFNPRNNVVAISEYYGDITDKIKISGSVDTLKIGDYYINYQVTDDFGLKTTQERQIIVK
ncbi:immunoglobulin-like domain-containing protein [uncultured Vibrio sp.]|uniref:immunoglobulin-like domain-containing protein n=1 Tax=uncultured Vibrio sp. TaxID=114054 RepID=UPI0026329E9D|nr:immunoglobulin-like domain-containing protein [uncultured Vibrio sp.]